MSARVDKAKTKSPFHDPGQSRHGGSLDSEARPLLVIEAPPSWATEKTAKEFRRKKVVSCRKIKALAEMRHTFTGNGLVNH